MIQFLLGVFFFGWYGNKYSCWIIVMGKNSWTQSCIDLSSLTRFDQYIKRARLPVSFGNGTQGLLTGIFCGRPAVTKTKPFVEKFLNAFCPSHHIMRLLKYHQLPSYIDQTDYSYVCIFQHPPSNIKNPTSYIQHPTKKPSSL